MNYSKYYRGTPILSTNEYIIDVKKGDISGDGITDDIYLIGTKTSGLSTDNIKLFIQNGKNNAEQYINLKTNKGYGPTLFLGDLTGDNIREILISIASGNTGQEGFFYVYGTLNNQITKLFDYEDFNNNYQYDVVYQNNYTVRVTSRFNNKIFTINLNNKGNEYLSRLYNNNGILKNPISGVVSPIIELNPVPTGTNKYRLYAIQRIVGYYNADTLGMIITPLIWNGRNFVIDDNKQYLA